MNKKGSYVRLIILLVLATTVAGTVTAQSQFDITLNVPYYAGISSSAGDVGEFSQYMFLVPDVSWHYYFGKNESFRFGPGLKMYTLILESMIYPVVSLESVLGDFVIDASFGGGLVFLFGIVTDFVADAIFLPEVSVAYRLGKKKIFRIGTGATMIIAPADSEVGDFAFIGTVFARWTF